MVRFRSFLALAFLFLTVTGGARAGDIVIEDAVANIMPAGSGGVFLTIQNQGTGDDSLVGVSSPAAKKTALHTTKMDNGVMKMRPVKAIEVPAGSSTALAHGGSHIMLMGVAKDLKPGDSIDLVLTFEQAGEVPVAVTIEAPGSAKAGAMDRSKKGGAMADMAPLEATVHLISAEGVGEAIGSLTLTSQEDGVLLTPALAGLTPGPHAFHVHKKPNCGPAEKDGQMVAGLAAGGHFDPAAKHKKKEKAGAKDKDTDQSAAGQSHGHKPAGDLPELMVEADGKATRSITITTLKLKQMQGRAIMIHAYGEEPTEADQPKGGGARIACAVVPKAK